ncbi:MAG: hypothetical protein M3Q29_16825 [Chloroflexota bacterium]|nr:hypothetical protein [Chloroflexota bacterium]
MPRTQSTANLIPVVEIAETHFVTTEGRVGVILEAEGRNMSIMSAEEAEGLVAAYADVLNYLDPGVHLQLVVSNKPLSAEEWVPVHMRQYDGCPPHLAHVRDTLAARYKERLAAATSRTCATTSSSPCPALPLRRGRHGCCPGARPRGYCCGTAGYTRSPWPRPRASRRTSSETLPRSGSPPG